MFLMRKSVFYGTILIPKISLQWRHNEHDSVSKHQPHDCLLSGLFKHRSKKTSKLRVTGLCAGNSPGTGEFPAQRTSNAENVSIWWRHHVLPIPTRSTSYRILYWTTTAMRTPLMHPFRSASGQIFSQRVCIRWETSMYIQCLAWSSLSGTLRFMVVITRNFLYSTCTLFHTLWHCDVFITMTS